MKRCKKFMALSLSLVMTAMLSACAGGKDNQSTKTDYGEVWSYPSTALFLQDDKRVSNKGEAALSYEMVRNEYESSQLLITANKDIRSFQLATSDLKNGDAVLAAENIDVYVQKYVEHEDGSTPDALIPMEAADRYGENVIASGNNGGFWVTVYAPEDTVAGVYEGTFQLVMNGENGDFKMDIPVSVDVKDYTLSNEVTARSLFSWRYNRVAVGELNGSVAMMECYYDFFQDYRISLEALPYEALEGEEVKDTVVKYYDEITSYTILKIAGEIGRELEDFPEEVTEQILAIASACTPDKNLFEKAMLYSIDEPRFDIDPPSRGAVMNRLTRMKAVLQDCVALIREDTTGIYDGLKQISNWEESIVNISNIIPMVSGDMEWLIDNENTAEGQALLNAINCLCPMYSVFEGNGWKDMQQLCEEYDIQLWWYNCGGDRSGVASYGLCDLNLLDKRTISWLQKKYDIVGNLYWDAAAYTFENLNNEYNNIYEHPYRFTGTPSAGDGYLAYPGAAYGIYGPLPSLRLMSIRDGLEEYEILNDIETKLTEQAEMLGSDFSVDKVMDYFYNQVYENGVFMHRDGENGLDFSALRSSLLKMAVSVDNGTGAFVNRVELTTNSAMVEYYISPGSTVTIAGEEQTPINGQKYQYTQNIGENSWLELSVTNAEGQTTEHRQFLSDPLDMWNGFEEQTSLSHVTVTEKSTAEWVSDSSNVSDGTAIRLKLTGNKTQDTTFVPSASISKDMFDDVRLSDLSMLYIDLYNPSSSVAVNVRIYSGAAYLDFGTSVLQTGHNTITLSLLNTKLDIADRIAIELCEYSNSNEDTLEIYELYLDAIYGVMKEGGV